MTQRFVLSFFLAGCATGFGASFTFYTSAADFQAALTGLPQQTITFDELATGPYATLTTAGVSFSGDISSPGVRVFDEATWTMPFFASATGNSLASASIFTVTLPGGVSAAGFLVGSTFIAATGSTSSTIEVLTADGAATGTVTASPSNLFPFLGVVSDSPISSLQIKGATLLTIDNFTFAGAGAVPEPGSAWMLAIPLGALAARRRFSYPRC